MCITYSGLGHLPDTGLLVSLVFGVVGFVRHLDLYLSGDIITLLGGCSTTLSLRPYNVNLLKGLSMAPSDPDNCCNRN